MLRGSIAEENSNLRALLGQVSKAHDRPRVRKRVGREQTCADFVTTSKTQGGSLETRFEHSFEQDEWVFFLFCSHSISPTNDVLR
jgi:hypothetical protein